MWSIQWTHGQCWTHTRLCPGGIKDLMQHPTPPASSCSPIKRGTVPLMLWFPAESHRCWHKASFQTYLESLFKPWVVTLPWGSSLAIFPDVTTALRDPFSLIPGSPGWDCLPCGLCWLTASRESSKISKNHSPVLSGAHRDTNPTCRSSDWGFSKQDSKLSPPPAPSPTTQTPLRTEKGTRVCFW